MNVFTEKNHLSQQDAQSLFVLFKNDKKFQKKCYLGCILFFIVSFITSLYYINTPFPETNVDSAGYLNAVIQIQKYGNLVDIFRLPVYPLMIVAIYFFAGQGNMMAVCIVQGILFVLTTLELYIVSLCLFRRSWVAFFFGLLIGTNLILLSYCKPLMTEGLSLWLLTTIILFIVLFVYKPNIRLFWLIACFLIFLLFTRPEWIFLPFLLYIYLLFALKDRNGIIRLLSFHMVLALTTIYVLIGGYITVNALNNQFVGLTTVGNMNLLGKVLQYHMQDEAPSEYQSISHRLDWYTQRGQFSPYAILGHEPALAANHGQLANDFARRIILNHPIEFILKSVPYFFSSLTTYYPVGIQQKYLPGPFDSPMNALLSIHRFLYALNALFPYCALIWLALLCWKPTRVYPVVKIMGCIVLVTTYGIIITTLGGYFEHDYMRVHIVFDPLIQLTIVSALLLGLKVIADKITMRLKRFKRYHRKSEMVEGI
jgi:hypothetical protein